MKNETSNTILVVLARLAVIIATGQMFGGWAVMLALGVMVSVDVWIERAKGK